MSKMVGPDMFSKASSAAVADIAALVVGKHGVSSPSSRALLTSAAVVELLKIEPMNGEEFIGFLDPLIKDQEALGAMLALMFSLVAYYEKEKDDAKKS